MKKYYLFQYAWKRSCIEILPDKKLEGTFLSVFLDCQHPQTKNRLPDEIIFHIQAGKKEFDIISVYNCMCIYFYSKDFLSIINEFTDMSDKSYKIYLPDASNNYYNIYNLKCYHLINRKELNAYPTILSEWPPVRFVLGNKDLGPIFSVHTTNCRVISEELMEAMKKAKITNVKFEEAYGYTPEEALEWAQANPEFADDFADKPWFKKLLDK